MTECRHGVSEDCPACMQATIDEWKQAASVEAGLRREFLARAERAEKALQALVDDVNDYERMNNLAPCPGRTECWDTVANAKQVLALVGGSCNAD